MPTAPSAPALLGLDLGTSRVKAVLFDASGRVLAAASREYPLSSPHPGWAEQDPALWWQAAAATLREVLASAPVAPAAVGVVSQSSALVAVDSAGDPLRPAPLWLDRRAAPQCAQILETLSEDELLRLSGNRLDPSYWLPKLLWLREHEPEVFSRAALFLHANGYLIHRLTGAATTDLTEGGMSLLYDLSTGAWSPRLLSAFDLPPEKFPPLVPPTHLAGHVTPQAAAATGLPEGVPVIAGAMDLLAAATGAGVTAPGQSFLVLGTATCLASCLAAPRPHPDLQMHNHALPGLWVHAANVDFGGAVLAWLRDLFRQAGATDLDYARMAALAEATLADPPDLLCLPYFVGQRAPLWDDDSRGVFFGLRPQHTAGHLIRAALEGNALALGRVQALQEQVRGAPLEEIRLAGGQTALPLANQLLADITGVPVVVMDAPEVTCHGAALLAGLALGVYASPAELASASRVARRFAPHPEQHERYRPLRDLLAEVYERLRPSFRTLREVTRT